MICRGKMLGHSAKSLYRGPDPRQKQPSAKTLCRGPDPRQRQAHGNNNYLPRAKPSAKGRPSATPPDTMSIPYHQSLPRASPLGPRQRLFNRFWKFSFKFFLPSAPGPALDKDSLCRVPSWHSANFHFFVFLTPNFLLGPTTLFTTSCSNLVFFLVFLLYLVD